jgi:hypothetical protein
MSVSIVGTSMTHGAATGGHRLGCRSRLGAVSFERSAGSLSSFLARYADEPAAGALRAGGVRIDHLDYDWSLNER